MLDDTTDFDTNQTLSWGRFTQPLDSLAVHPAGYVIGVATSTHKMEILELPNAPSDQMSAPNAIPFAVMKSGPGTRPGLMFVPVAVTVTSDGTVLVLEFGNNRIQAFDTTANPVDYFQQKSSPFAPLRAEEEMVTYLDLGIERLGYLYVLSFVADGLSADDYRLDVYTPDGEFLARTTGVAAARMAVDRFRNVYTLNYETIANAPRIEPSLSQWLPKTPGVD